MSNTTKSDTTTETDTMSGGGTTRKNLSYCVIEDAVRDARSGNSIAQFVVGAAVLDLTSDAVARDEANRFLIASAESGFPPAMFYLASHEDFGPSLKSCDRKPNVWLDSAIKNGHVPAYRLINENSLAIACESDLKAEIKWAEGLQEKIVDLECRLANTTAELSQCHHQSDQRLAWHTQSRLHCEYLEALLRKAGIPFINRYGHAGVTVENQPANADGDLTGKR